MTVKKNTTPAENQMWYFLKENFSSLKFTRQKPLDNFIVDFYCKSKNLVIEIDGDVHLIQKEKDCDRDKILLDKYNLRTIRFTNKEVFDEKDYLKKVLDDLLH